VNNGYFFWKKNATLYYVLINAFTLYFKLNPNGFISFGSRFQSSSPKKMNDKHLTKPMLALYWYDLDSSRKSNSEDSGKLYYHIYESNDTSMLSLINRLVELKIEPGKFKAAWALVATWDHVRRWNNLKNTQEVSEFLCCDHILKFYINL